MNTKIQEILEKYGDRAMTVSIKLTDMDIELVSYGQLSDKKMMELAYESLLVELALKENINEN